MKIKSENQKKLLKIGGIFVAAIGFISAILGIVSYYEDHRIKQIPTSPVNASPTPNIDLVSISSEVKPEEDASIVIKTVPGVICIIQYITPAGRFSEADGLVPIVADSEGVCSWKWRIGSKTSPGEGKVVIKIGSIEETFPLVIKGE